MIRFAPIILLALAASQLAADPLQATRGGRVGWARLITPSRSWDVHRDSDVMLERFIRSETTLNLDPRWYSVKPTKLDELCIYPLIYVKDLSAIRNREALENIRQYLHRGGFLCVDACTFVGVTPDAQVYFDTNRELLQQLVPGAEVRILPEDHAIYRSYFSVRENELFTPDTSSFRKVEPNGLYGVFDGTRMIAVISMYGLECGWPQAPLRAPGCMKMLVNIYVYAMTR